jgi:hypothetical protein
MKRPTPNQLDELLFSFAALCFVAVWLLIEITK